MSVFSIKYRRDGAGRALDFGSMQWSGMQHPRGRASAERGPVRRARCRESPRSRPFPRDFGLRPSPIMAHK